MAYVKSQYSKEQTQKWTVATMCVLNDADRALTGEEIRNMDLELTGLTPQKHARILGELCDVGFVVKTKGKNGKMTYRSRAALVESGAIKEV